MITPSSERAAQFTTDFSAWVTRMHTLGCRVIPRENGSGGMNFEVILPDRIPEEGREFVESAAGIGRQS